MDYIEEKFGGCQVVKLGQRGTRGRVLGVPTSWVDDRKIPLGARFKVKTTDRGKYANAIIFILEDEN